MSGGSERRLTWRGKLLFALIAPVAFFGLFELTLRVAGFRYEGRTSPIEEGVRGELGEARVYRSDPVLLWTLRHSSYLDYPRMGFPGIETNAHGLRGAGLPATKHPDEIRVLCLGDSVTFGLALRDEETWPARMEAALRRAPALQDRQVRVLNGAVPGWSSVQGLRLLSKLTDLAPDLIVFWFGMNGASPARGVPDSVYRPDPVPSRMLQTLRGLRVYQLIGSVVDGLRSAPADGPRVSPEEYRECVRRLLESERGGGPPTIFVRMPEQLDFTAGQLEQVLARAEEEGVELILGPRQLLRWVVPAPAGCDLTGRKAVRDGIEAILFEPDPGNPGYNRADARIRRSALARDLRRMRGLKRALDANLAGLPPGSVDSADLFGATPSHIVFSDNCHLTEEGARLAGEALAARALRLLTE